MTDMNWKRVAEADCEVGGRSIDLDQLSTSLRRHVGESFDLNSVPAGVISQLRTMDTALNFAMKEVQKLGAMMVKVNEARGLRPDGDPLPPTDPPDEYVNGLRLAAMELNERHMGETDDEYRQRLEPIVADAVAKSWPPK